jgi:glycosyltransferase 2 family protein
MKNYRRMLGYALTVVILFFLVRTLYSSWAQVIQSGFKFTLNAPLVAVSLVLLVIARAFAVEAWRRILIALGEYVGFTFAMRVWFLSNLARYVPGNIWQVAAMMAMVEEKGVSKTNALLSQVIYTSIALSMAGLFGLEFIFERTELLAGIPELARMPYVQYAPLLGAIAFIALIAVFSAPHSYRLIVSVARRITKRQLVAPDHTLVRGVVPPLLSMAMWLVNGIAFFLFVASITQTPPSQLVSFIAINAGAYFIGYVTFITPSGLGFREAALAIMLGVFFPVPVAVAISLAARVWSTIGELLGVIFVSSAPERVVAQWREGKAR